MKDTNRENYADKTDNIAMMQAISARKMAQSILDALSKGEIKQEFAFELLSETREQINNAYNQRIELSEFMGADPYAMDAMKRNELKSLDEAVNKITNRDLNDKTKEELEGLFR
jgi:hypothetical protein